jgi:hypothetical protein
MTPDGSFNFDAKVRNFRARPGTKQGIHLMADH